MVKRWFAIVVTLLLVSFLVVGCGGVSQEEHDAVLADLATAESDLAAAEAQVAALEADLAAASEGQLPTLQVGAKMVFSYVTEETTSTLTEEIIGEETVENRDCYVIDMVMSYTQDGVVYTTTGMKYWMDKATGLLGVKMETTTTANGQVTTSTQTYSYNPWTSLFPLEIGKEVETEKTTINYYEGEPYGEPVVTTEKYTVVSKEDVTVTAGTFSCWEIAYYDSALDTTQTMWYSYEAKTMVKMTDADGKTIMELQSYSVS